MITILEALRADPHRDTAGKVHIHLLWRCLNHRSDSASCASSMCAARANHGIVSFHGGRVFVTSRSSEGFACVLKIVTKVLVVKDFGVRGQRTDRGANAAGIHGIGIGRALSIREATLVRQRSLFLACFKLVDMARQDEGHRHFSPIALPNRDGSIAGHKVVEELSTENVCKKKVLSRHFGSSLFQSLCVTRHVPFMVWRDGPDCSADGEVSCGGTCLDWRCTPQYHVRAVLDNRKQTWWMMRVLPRLGHRIWKTLTQELHMETARSRTTRWLHTHCLRSCANRSAQNIQSWPHLSQRSQESPRKQWQFPIRPRRQESCVKKHVRPCGELAARVRHPRRIRLSRLR